MLLYDSIFLYNQGGMLWGINCRLLCAYVSNAYDFYDDKLVKIPTPQFVVFYNGTKDEPDKEVLKLSDAFNCDGRFEPALECYATVLNINYEHNQDLMDRCKELRDYSILVYKIRRNRDLGMNLEKAIDEAIEDCISEDVLKDILMAHKMEAKAMLFTEYSAELHFKNVKKTSYENGKDTGMDIMGKLYFELEKLGRLDEYPKALKDTKYRDKLIAELLSGEDIDLN